MSSSYPYPKAFEIPTALGALILDAAYAMAQHTGRAFREARRRGRGTTLRPGKDTPLWNELRSQLRPYAAKYGQQANLARVLNLPRQRVNAFITAGSAMPDAERTLQLLAWLMAVRQDRRPV